jgi:hypothetical protein
MNGEEFQMNDEYMYIDEIDYSFHFDPSFKAFSKCSNIYFA